MAPVDPATMAPTMDPEMVRIILTLVADGSDCGFIQSDFVAAYLMSLQGMTAVPTSHVLQLHINLYGLCKSARRWYCDLSMTLKAQGWTCSNFENCSWRRMDNPLCGSGVTGRVQVVGGLLVRGK
jgi:hypothetical protein